MTPRKPFHANLLERQDSVLGVFAFEKLGMNCCSGDFTTTLRHSKNGKPQRPQNLSLGRKECVQ
jgi:hypothetical protein